MFLPRKAHERTLEKNMKRIGTTGALTLAVLAALNSAAALATDDGWYGGINRPVAREDQRRRSTASSEATPHQRDDTDIGYRLFGG
jgi:hypothetical protein